MYSLNEVFIRAKENNKIENIEEVQTIVNTIIEDDHEIVLDWDTGAGEEWARLVKKEVGVICMINIRIRVGFVCNNISDNIANRLSQYYIVNVNDFSTEEWTIDLQLLKESTPEISWNASPYAVDTSKLSLNDLYYATV